MKPLNVAVWGLGPHAIRNIVPALQATPGLRLHGLCSRNHEVVADVRRRHECLGWQTPDEMLADPSVDVVYVSTPIGLHASQVSAVLAAGKHAWCEKPLAAGCEEATRIVSASRQRNRTVAEGFMYLYHPHFAGVRDFVRSGRLGSVHTVACRFGIPALERPGFRNDPDRGGGAFLDIGSYPISATTALFAEDHPEIVFAELVTAEGSPVDTSGRAIVRYGTGTSVLLEWCSHCAYRNEVDLWGVLGSASTDRIFSKPADHVPVFRVLDAHGRESREAGTAANHFVEMFAGFRQMVEDGAAAEAERAAIVRRARLTDTIRQHARP